MTNWENVLVIVRSLCPTVHLVRTCSGVDSYLATSNNVEIKARDYKREGLQSGSCDVTPVLVVKRVAQYF